MKIENPAALRFMMQDDIYLLPADKAGPVEKAEAPVIQTQTDTLKYLGDHKKSFLIIGHYTGHEFIADAHLTALQSILSRKGYGLDDIAIFNLAGYPEAGFEQLLSYFKPAKLLVLGNEAMPKGMQKVGFNTPVLINGCATLYSFSFDEMMDSTANKKAFWEQMKNL